MDRGITRLAAALALELAPAVALNFAVAFAVATVLRQVGPADLAAPVSIGSGIAAFLIAWALLRSQKPVQKPFELPVFEHEPVDVIAGAEPEPLRTDPADEANVDEDSGDELLLDDILHSIGPESRVVRLFDPAAMPTAGELRAQIDRHLNLASGRPPVPDASAELHEALAALRQSLR